MFLIQMESVKEASALQSMECLGKQWFSLWPTHHNGGRLGNGVQPAVKGALLGWGESASPLLEPPTREPFNARAQ